MTIAATLILACVTALPPSISIGTADPELETRRRLRQVHLHTCMYRIQYCESASPCLTHHSCFKCRSYKQGPAMPCTQTAFAMRHSSMLKTQQQALSKCCCMSQDSKSMSDLFITLLSRRAMNCGYILCNLQLLPAVAILVHSNLVLTGEFGRENLC
jgi:hypothetical protein